MAQRFAKHGLRDTVLKGCLVSAGTLAFLMLLALVGSALIFRSPRPEVKVPNMIGLTAEQAQRKAKAEGLRADMAGLRYDNEIPAGAVCDTDPSPGRVVRQGRLIELYTSKGPQTAIVPDAIGHTVDEAQQSLAAEGLALGPVWKQRSRYEVGTVVGQEPTAGRKLPPGSPVELDVSGGPNFGVVHVPGEPDRLFRAVVVQVPADGAYHRVVVQKTHDGVTQTLDDGMHQSGASVEVDFEGEPGDEISVYLDERRILDRTL